MRAGVVQWLLTGGAAAWYLQKTMSLVACMPRCALFPRKRGYFVSTPEALIIPVYKGLPSPGWSRCCYFEKVYDACIAQSQGKLTLEHRLAL